MDSLNGSTWHLLDCNFIDDGTSSDLCWVNQRNRNYEGFRHSVDLDEGYRVKDQDLLGVKLGQMYNSGIDIDFSHGSSRSLEQECSEKCTRKRGRVDSCSKAGDKACREKLRRERLNDRVLDQLKCEAKEFKEENERLQEEIRSLKAEKNELRNEKLMLKSEKEKMEHQLRATTVTNPGNVPPPLAAYHGGVNKMPLFPGYGVYPMWHYLPPSTHETSRDHELRPPAA
ncbi:hypothetical protein Ancab_013130 [Ancistrocladus abbreviatus]